jgi:outer membrane biosynthesis protein TonB
MKWLAILLLLTTSVLAENDTATSLNILPNAGTTSSNMDQFDLDGVQSGSTGALTNNSTHNGFTITCPTEVQNACGRAFNGELEASYQMKVGADGTLIGIDGTESGTTYTSTQQKLDGGIQLDSQFSVQNCEDNNSSYTCGNAAGADDSYKLHIKIKDAQGNTLADMTTTRLDDAGYYGNSRKFDDTLVYNGTGAASYEWYWEGYDGSLNTSTTTLGPNLLGAELGLDFPIEDHEALSTQEIEDINEALETTELTENEIYDIISGLESMIEQEFLASGKLEQENRIEISFEEGIVIEVASKETGAIVMEAPIAQEMFAPVMEEMPIETLKEEMVAMVQEEMPFMEMMEEVAPGPTMEEPPEEEPKAMSAGPMIEEESNKEPEPSNKGPATMEMASAPTEEKQEEPKEEAVQEKPSVVEEKNERQESKEPEEKKSASETATTSVVSKQNNTKQKKIQSKETVKPKLEKVMAKIDEKIKNPVKNLQLKNLIKMDAMTDQQVSLDVYNVAFYKPKDIYLDQLNMVDNRLIYTNKSLATYIQNDKMEIKARKLMEINSRKQQLLIELEVLKNG